LFDKYSIWTHTKNMTNRCFIIGGGPSIKDVDLNLIKKEYIYGVNEAFKLGDWIDTWVFGDSDIFKRNQKAINAWPNKIASCASAAKRHKKIEYYDRCKIHALCMEPNKLSWPSMGANSGAAAINLAIKKGFDEIILLGFDMKQVNGQNNYHNYYTNIVREDAYIRFNEAFEAMAKEIKVKVINANPDSALNCFPKANLKDLL